MKKLKFIFTVPALFALTLTLSCGNTPPGLDQVYNLSIDNTAYADDATYDFSLTEAESTGRSVTAVLTNAGEENITVTSVVLSDTANFSITAPELPLTAASGETAETTLRFTPQSSGAITATLSFTIEGLTDPFVLNLTGEGNYAPVVRFGIQVSDAGIDAANGFYERDGFLNEEPNRRPNYTKAGDVKYYCYDENFEVYMWGINTTQSTSFIYASTQSLEMVPPETGWIDDSWGDVTLAVTRYDITGISAYSHEQLTANYLYSDAEGDAENTSAVTYQWYRSDAKDGTYSPISGAVSKTYTPSSDAGYYLKVEITTAALTGITSGSATMSSPTIKITTELAIE